MLLPLLPSQHIKTAFQMLGVRPRLPAISVLVAPGLIFTTVPTAMPYTGMLNLIPISTLLTVTP